MRCGTRRVGDGVRKSEFKYLGTKLCKHGDRGRNERESCESYMCHRITCKSYERKK